MYGMKSTLAFVIISLLTGARLMADCSQSVTVQVPAAACKSGTATAAVTGSVGATYAWTVDGGTIVGDSAGDRINISLGTNATATASVTMTSAGCVSHGSGVIALHDPFNVRIAAIPAAHAGEPLTISWAYENGAPAHQTISGADFGNVSLEPSIRSYTYTPQTSGSRQAVIDAALPAQAGSATSGSRQRAVAKSPVSASGCATVRSAMSYSVGLCAEPSVVVDGPASVVAGTSFQLSVRPQPGAVATWTITNGSPATATGDSVTITAGPSGTVGVSVRLARGACVGQLDRGIDITAQAVCNSPKVVVSAGPVGCGSASVNAAFTGTPPFKGMWSDGSQFTTSATTLTRMVTMPGNYSIVSFEDAACAGSSSGVAVISAVGPTATIVGKANSCIGTDKVTVQFTGKPPFSGAWLDGTGFLTSEMQIEKPVTATGPIGVAYGSDGTDCRLGIVGSVQGIQPVTFRAERFCLSPDFDNVVLVYANIDASLLTTGFTNPLTVTWSDGVTMSANGYPVYRVGIKPDQTTTYTIVSGHDANCPAIIGPPASVTVYASAIPDFELGVGDICTGLTRTASLVTPPPNDATVLWFIDNGSIVSGQGTSSVQYQTGVPGTMVLGCTFTYPDSRCPMSHRGTARIDADPVGTLSLAKPQISSGHTVLINFTVDSATWTWYLHDSANQNIPWVGICGAHTNCLAQYSSTQAGTTNITLEMEGFCSNKKSISVPLTIVP
jgi:hypothetical protein